MKRNNAILGLLALTALAACDDNEVNQASSLEGPRAAIAVRGDVCIDTFVDSTGTIIEGTTKLCDEGERSNLGLVVSSHDDRLGIIDLYPADYDLDAAAADVRPRFLDIDPSTPGVTHLEVGRLPVDVAASPDGRAAYTLDQLDRTITVVDLLNVEALTTRYHLAETPVAFAVTPTGEILSVGGVPSSLTIHQGTVCDDSGCDVPEDEPATLPLNGSATAIEITPDGSRAFITYRDVDQLTVVALDEDGIGDSCIDAAAPPCTTANIPLTWGCRDGIDNDGDGRTDRDDPQCLSALGGEAPDVGPSRTVATDCNDGIDNDGDGLIDLNDDACIDSGGVSEVWDDEPVVTACNDGIDNDGDGLVDLNDEACYSGAGRTESLVPTLGFDAVSVDNGGFLAWVLDTANQQVLLVDAQRLELIDVPATSRPTYDNLVQRLGIRVPASPISIEARVNALNGEGFYDGTYNDEPVYYRTNFSAWVGIDNGQAYNVVALNSYCDVNDPGCVFLPELPLQPEELTCPAVECTCEGADCPCAVETCASDLDCFDGESCLSGSCVVTCTADTECETDEVCLGLDEMGNPIEGTTPTCGFDPESLGDDDCTSAADCRTGRFISRRQRCGAGEQRVLFNPIFDVNQSSDEQARVVGLGTCTVPGDLVADLNAFALSTPDAPLTPAACDSTLLPQPRSVLAPTPSETDGPGDIDLSEFGRADVLQRQFAAFDIESRSPAFASVPFSVRVTNEVWSATYEGELPRTRRGDWLLPTATETTTIDGEELETITLRSSANLCDAGVETGDIFVLSTDPLDRNDCLATYAREDDDEFRSYRVVARDADSITLSAIDGLAPLPVRAADGESGCYESGVSGSILADQTWVVAGGRTGYLSALTTRDGRCIPGRISRAADGRVETGGVYAGPTLGFQLYPGFVEPERGLTFEFETESGFSSDRIRTGPENTDTVGLLPYHMFYREAEDSDDIELLLATDPDTSFIFVRSWVPGLADDGDRRLFTYQNFLD